MKATLSIISCFVYHIKQAAGTFKV